MTRDIDEGYDELIDELEAAVDEGDQAERGKRIRMVRLKIEDLLREEMGLPARLPPVDRRWGPDALN